MNELVSLFERQIDYAEQQGPERLFLMIPQLVGFVAREPRLSAVVADLSSEYEAERNAYAEMDSDLAEELKALWRVHGNWFQDAWQNMSTAGRGTNVTDGYRHPRELQSLLDVEREALPEWIDHSIESSRLSFVMELMRTMWLPCVTSEPLDEAGKDRCKEFLLGLKKIERQSDIARRRREVVERIHAGAAWRRVLLAADSLCPPDGHVRSVVSAWEDPLTMIAEMQAEDLANVALGHTAGSTDVFRPAECGKVLRDDLAILRLEIVRRIGLLGSYIGLLNRFKTKCEQFLAQDLRRRCNSNSRTAERILTLSVAEYLFDYGLNPLFGAQVVSLRPDLFESSQPQALYVEAKQYKAGDSPSTIVRKAAWQIWDTWSELDAQHRVPEAFLLVFRLGGPLVAFEGPASFHGRTLHPIFVDISPMSQRGSRQKTQPVEIGACELLPRSKVTTVSKSASGKRRRTDR